MSYHKNKRNRQRDNYSSDEDDEQEDQFVISEIKKLKGAIKQKDRNTIEDHFRIQYQQQHHKTPYVQKHYNEKQENQLQNTPKQIQQDDPPHYKQDRKTKRLAKHINSSMPNHQEEYGDKQTKKMFNRKQPSFDQDFHKRSIEGYSIGNNNNQRRNNNNNNNRYDDNRYDDNRYDDNSNDHQGNNNNRRRDNDDRDDNRVNFRDKYKNKRDESDDSPRYRNDHDERFGRKDDRENNYRKDKGSRNYKKNKGFNKKTIFNEYYSQEQVQKGIESQDIFEGIFFQQENQKKMAQIKCPLFMKKVHINTIKDQNRGMHGCLVAFKIIRAQGLNKLEKKDISESEDEIEEIIDDIPETIKEILEQKIAEKQKLAEQQCIIISDDDEWEDVEQLDENENQDGVFVNHEKYTKIKQKETVSKLEKYQKSKLEGSIVRIITNPYEKRELVGKIDIRKRTDFREKQEFKDLKDFLRFIENNYYLSFKPINKRVTWFNIQQLDEKYFETMDIDFKQCENIETEFKEYLDKHYYSARYDEWKESSNYPNATILREIGIAGNIDVEADVLLTEHQVYATDFSKSCMDALEPFNNLCNQEGEYVIPLEERQKRLDLTKEYICTVDPVTARDLDDALSINEVEKDIFEIGVHIADVSYFVESESEIDKEAILRTTSVYLVYKVLPMLPRLLCEKLCSLNRNVERLAFSVFFYIQRDGVVLWDRPMRAVKSIIKSCGQLSYDVVNQLIKGEIQNLSQSEERYKIADGFDPKIMEQKLLLLNEIGQNRRNLRFNDGGAMSFSRHKLRFQIGEDLKPIQFIEEKREAAQFMVEEWMLLANQFVGKKLVQFDQHTAILRKHQPPKQERIDFFQKQLEICGIKLDNLDFSTSKKLKETFDFIANNPDITQESKEILTFRMIRLMEAAKYFVVLESQPNEWIHFALNFDVYTHFTSPIRRYPDILVHRRLLKAITDDKDQNEEQKSKTQLSLQAIMASCNECKLNARRASDGCDQIFLCLYLKEHPMEINAYVTSIRQQGIEVIIPELNLEKKIDFKLLKNIESYKIIEESKIIKKPNEIQEEKENQNQKQNEDNKKKKSKKQEKTLEEPNYSLLISYKDPQNEGANRLFLIRNLTTLKVRVSGTDTFPIDFKIDIFIPSKQHEQGYFLI